MYESPITVFIEQAVQSITEQRDDQICNYITEKFDVQVDREELIKALNYDRQQYEEGYKDGRDVNLALYQRALLDTKFLKYYCGISKVDLNMIASFNPVQVIDDYKEWKNDFSNKMGTD